MKGKKIAIIHGWNNNKNKTSVKSQNFCKHMAEIKSKWLISEACNAVCGVV